MAKGRAPKTRGRREADELVKRLAEPEFRERAQVTEKDMKQLDRICSGKYVRNASAIVAAFKMRAEFAYAKPRQDLGVELKDVTESREITDEEWERLAKLEHEIRGEGSGA
jgi:hypothetical protein